RVLRAASSIGRHHHGKFRPDLPALSTNRGGGGSSRDWPGVGYFFPLFLAGPRLMTASTRLTPLARLAAAASTGPFALSLPRPSAVVGSSFLLSRPCLSPLAIPASLRAPLAPEPLPAARWAGPAFAASSTACRIASSTVGAAVARGISRGTIRNSAVSRLAASAVMALGCGT